VNGLLQPSSAAPAPNRDELQQLRARIARFYFAVVAGTTAVLPVLIALAPSQQLPGSPRWTLVTVFTLLALLAAACIRLPTRWLFGGMAAVALASTAAIGVSATMLGWGLSAPGIGFIALHAAIVAGVVGARSGALVALAGAAVVISLGSVPMQLRSVTVQHAAIQVLLIGCAFGSGWLLSQVLARFMRTAEDREQRFRGLLGIAVDAYWEMDTDYRLVAVTLQRGRNIAAGPEAGVGKVPWETPQFDCDPDILDRVRADLEARLPFRDVSLQWRRNGRIQHFKVSGEPRLDERGVFCGYWGVTREVTEELLAQQALAHTESRYHDLFVSIPTSLVLHRNGLVMNANPAALALFGFPDLDAMVGTDLLQVMDGAETRDRARRRCQELESMPPGEALLVAEFKVQSRTGRRLLVRATGVAVATEGGPAVLSIFVDDTERQAAEGAVRRSEALLSHLVASSPDVITLTDLVTGRYAMVNQTFERITGWSAADVIGRTALEVGVWLRGEDRQDFVSQVQASGQVRDQPLQFGRRNGTTVSMLASGARFEMDKRDYLVINARDVTDVERNRLEREAILDNASIGIALTREQRFQLVNPAFETMLGWPHGSIIGAPGAVVWPSEQAYADIGARISGPLSRGEQVEVECEVRRHDGSTCLCRMLARAVDPHHPGRGGTIWIVEDITERRRVEAALARARDEAEAANRAKSAFLANTSHELRTPLNGLLGMAQLARTPGLADAKRNQYLDLIVDSAQSLALIVSDILDLSKIEAGKLALEVETFDLAAMLASVRRGYAALAAARSLTLNLDADPALGLVRGDALRVRQILTNYISNAIKFTPEGGVRLVVHRMAGERVRFEVHDTGPGIPQATLARLFQPFTQADDSTTRRFGGTGLGLSICEELAQLMGGDVGVSSTLGQGSCFWAEVQLPACDAMAVVDLPAAAAEAPIQGVHVLMVDDNDINMMVAVAQLEQFGVRVGQAVDGQQALDAVAAAAAAGDPYEVVIMDLQMPVKSGYEVTRELRCVYSAEALPIVAYTAAALVSERASALAAGMNDFLPKPTEPERLRAVVARWSRRARAVSV
jgi:PAS domain S-box-containing protein